MGLGRIGTCQHQHVGIAHLLLLVGQLQEFLIDLVEFLIFQIHAVHVQTMLQGGPAATCRQQNAVIIDTHILRVHDLVGMHILQHAVLMDTAGMGKGIAADNGLVGLYGHIHQRRHHAGDGINLRGVDIRFDTKVLVTLQDHGNLLQRGVAGPFTDTVDGHLHLSGTSHHTTEGIGRCQAQIIVTMG